MRNRGVAKARAPRPLGDLLGRLVVGEHVCDAGGERGVELSIGLHFDDDRVVTGATQCISKGPPVLIQQRPMIVFP